MTFKAAAALSLVVFCAATATTKAASSITFWAAAMAGSLAVLMALIKSASAMVEVPLTPKPTAVVRKKVVMAWGLSIALSTEPATT